MTTVQRYVSKELTHFIGKDLGDNEERYKLLIEVLSSGWLTHPPHDPRMSSSLSIIPRAQISKNEMYNPAMVCFCDIPVTDLDIHMNKYSQFGISFLKQFLASNGANPVFYVANFSSVPSKSRLKLNRGQVLDRGMQAYHEFFDALIKTPTMPKSNNSKITNLQNKFMEVRIYLEFELFGYIKCFDNTLPEDDINNYYMEREWRIFGNLNFTLDDVYRVILPKYYAKRFRVDIPGYAGQVTLTDLA